MSERDGLRTAIRAAISSAYYDARNGGETMETAADNAADAVVAALSDDGARPTDGEMRTLLAAARQEGIDYARTRALSDDGVLDVLAAWLREHESWTDTTGDPWRVYDADDLDAFIREARQSGGQEG